MKKIDIDRSWLWLIAALAFIVMCFYLSACMTPKKINKFKELYCKDSVSIQIKERVVKVPIYYSDSSMLEIWLQCDSLGNIYYTNWKQIEGKYSHLKAKLDSNIIRVKTVFKIRDSIRYTERDTNKYQQANVTTNILTKSQKNQIKAFWWLLAIVIVSITVFILYKIYRLKIKSLVSKIVG
jgi:hypothetical protein